MSEFDTDKSGSLEFQEFIKMIASGENKLQLQVEEKTRLIELSATLLPSMQLLEDSPVRRRNEWRYLTSATRIQASILSWATRNSSRATKAAMEQASAAVFMAGVEGFKTRQGDASSRFVHKMHAAKAADAIIAGGGTPAEAAMAAATAAVRVGAKPDEVAAVAGEAAGAAVLSQGGRKEEAFDAAVQMAKEDPGVSKTAVASAAAAVAIRAGG